MKFERKNFIKDLFNPKEILNNFNWIQFESIETFCECVEKELISTYNKTLEFFIYNISQYKDFLEILKGVDLRKRSGIIIRFLSKYVAEECLKLDDYTFDVLLDFEDYLGRLDTKKRLVKIIKLNKDNYKYKLNDIQKEYLKSGVFFYKLEFDYNSFNDMTIKELEELQYWIFQLRILVFYTANYQRLSIVEQTKFIKKIFISKELILYLDEKKEKWSFDLKKHLKDDGESIYYTDINKLRMYVDLDKEAVISFYTINNWFMVDYSQHKFLNDVPLITSLIDRWLYVKY